MNAHETPRGTRMMWNPSVNAICERAHGTGSTARMGASVVMIGSALRATPRPDRRSGERLLLQALELRLVDHSLGSEVGQLAQLVRRTRPVLGDGALDVLPCRSVLGTRCLGSVLGHLVAPRYEVNE